jgi:malonyl-CoA O-methyltransferase
MSNADTAYKRRLRRNFGRAAANYENLAVLSHEVIGRLMERLAMMQVKPERLLDLGSGTGIAARALADRYRSADVVALDLSLPMLQQQSVGRAWTHVPFPLRRRARRISICADFEQLPLPDASFDLVLSNLALQWSADVAVAFAEVSRVLRTGGLFLFSTLGPDTLKELVRASADAPGPSALHRFIDMHDLGDALVASGFADPVMEMETLTLTYESLEGLWRDLKGAGALSGRTAPGLRTPRWRERIAQRYELLRRDGRLPASFELIYGHAWKAAPRQRASADGVSVVQFHPRSRRM